MMSQQTTCDFARDLQTRGCPACNAVWQAVSDFWSFWINRLAEDERARQENAADFGLCPFHSWQFFTMSSPKGISKGYAPLMDILADNLTELAHVGEGFAPQLRALVKSPSDCRVCLLMKEKEARYLQYFSGCLSHGENRSLYASSQGLCLRHLSLIMSDVMDRNVQNFLLLEAARKFKAISESMRSYVLKRDKLERHLQDADEKDAYLRAIIHVAGARNLCALNYE